MAMALLSLGRMDEAQTFLKRALALQPTHPQSLIVLGQIELDAGRLSKAGEYLQSLYEGYPEMPQARQLFAAWCLRAGIAASAAKDIATAERHYRQGLAANPDHTELNANLGVLCLVAGRFEEARTPLEAYRRLKPADPQSSLFLGQVYARLGRINEARQILTEGVEVARRAGNVSTAKFCQEILQQL
jgi:predicted Zn-dependent protease